MYLHAVTKLTIFGAYNMKIYQLICILNPKGAKYRFHTLVERDNKILPLFLYDK